MLAVNTLTFSFDKRFRVRMSLTPILYAFAIAEISFG